MNLRIGRRVRRLAVLSILLSTWFSLIPMPANAAKPSIDSATGDWLNQFRTCVKVERQLGVLFLIDESKS